MTPNKEDFIKAIYHLGGDQHVIGNKKLVEELGVSAASVTDMNARLLKEEVIEYEPYRGVQLTEKGLTIAYKLIRKHRLWEVFLSEKLGYEWNEVHADADLLEHASSDLLIERLDHFLGSPKFDPHGDIIPNKYGIIKKEEYPPLTEVKEGDTIVVKKVDDQEDFLAYLSDKRIQLGKEFKVIEIEPFEGPITLLDPDKTETLISYKAAFRILVEIK